jgi:hypothetical protein
MSCPSYAASRVSFPPGGKSGPERPDHAANDGVIELTTVHAQSFEQGETVQSCEQGQSSGLHVLDNDSPSFSLGLEILDKPQMHPAEGGVGVALRELLQVELGMCHERQKDRDHLSEVLHHAECDPLELLQHAEIVRWCREQVFHVQRRRDHRGEEEVRLGRVPLIDDSFRYARSTGYFPCGRSDSLLNEGLSRNGEEFVILNELAASHVQVYSRQASERTCVMSCGSA